MSLRKWWSKRKRRKAPFPDQKGLSVSEQSYFDKYTTFSEYNVLHGNNTLSRTSIGRFTYIAGAAISNTTIGHFCSIGPGTQIGGFGRHPVDWASTHPVFYSTKKQAGISFVDIDYFEEHVGPVVIGNDVWIGANVLILDGVAVGDGAIIAAGAVITQNVAPYAIVGGVPGKVIRYRFSPTIVQRFLELKWWDWPEEKLRRHAALFRLPADGDRHPLFEDPLK